MSGSKHHDQVQQSSDTNPVKLAIGVTIGAVALVIGIILTVQFAVGSYGGRDMKDDPSMNPQAVAKRLAPVAEVAVDPNAAPPAAAPVAAPAAAAPATAAAASAAAAATPAAGKTADAGGPGKATYDTTCSVCHATGVAGAPKVGDKAAWAPRLKTGIEALHASALKGKGAMPPKGGNTALTDEAVKAAVDYLAAAAK
jgi:cytochrome c5